MRSASRVRVLLGLALPIILLRATQAAITFADAIQVRHLGDRAIAATTGGGVNIAVLLLLPSGTVYMVQSFVAQLTGAGRQDEAPRFAWYGLAIAALAATIMIASIPLIGPVLAQTGYSPALRDEMNGYMSIRMWSVGAVLGAEVLGNWYGGLGNTRMQLLPGIITLVSAVFLNWMLIDGHLGAPAMGVDGAALASVLANVLGFGFLVVAFWRRWGGAPRARTRGLAMSELVRFVKLGLPHGVNWFLECAAFQIFVSVVLASLGDETLTAMNLVLVINSISYLPAFGIASAGAILAAQEIGRRDRDAVWPHVRAALVCSVTWMGGIGVIYAIFPGHVMSIFTSESSGQIVAIGTTMLLLAPVWQVTDAVFLTFCESLRAAGDTRWLALVRIGLAWLVLVPSAWLAVNRFGCGVLGAMLCMITYNVFSLTAVAWRFWSGAWRRMNNIV